jgi:hypothetical protein
MLDFKGQGSYILIAGKSKISGLTAINWGGYFMAHWKEFLERESDIPVEEYKSDIVELIDNGLNAEFSPDEIRDMVTESRGENAEGFADRFADAIESRIDEKADRPTSDNEDSSVKTENDSATDNIGDDEKTKYQTLAEQYDDIKDKYLFRNIFVLSAKLELDVEAYKEGKPGANGKEITGGDIAMDVLNLMRGNILDSMLEVVLRDYFDEKYPGVSKDTDNVTTDNDDIEKRNIKDEKYVSDKEHVVRDDGFVKSPADLEKAGINVESMRTGNPLYAQFKGVDMSETPIERDGMRIWDTGKYDRMSAVTDNGVESLSIPPVRLVELHENFYHVDPFGKVLTADTEMNEGSRLDVGDRISSLDVSARRGNEEKFEALAQNNGISVTELKENIIAQVEEKFAEKIEGQIDTHYEYLEKEAIPEAKTELEAYKADLETLAEQKMVLADEYGKLQDRADNGELGIDEDERMTEIEGKLERNAEAEKDINGAIEKVEIRLDQMEKAIETYDNVKDRFALEDAPTVGRFYTAVEAENTAGRTDNIYYAGFETDQKLGDILKEAHDDIVAVKDVDADSEDKVEKADVENTQPVEMPTGNEDVGGVSVDDTSLDSSDDEKQAASDNGELFDINSGEENGDNPESVSIEGINGEDAISDYDDVDSENIKEIEPANPVTIDKNKDDDAVAVAESEKHQADIEKDSKSDKPNSELQDKTEDNAANTNEDKEHSADIEVSTEHYDELREELAGAFMTYTNTDFYSLQADLYPSLSSDDLILMAQSNIMNEAFIDMVYARQEAGQQLETTPGMSFGVLAHEIASFHDGSEMQTIEALADTLYERSGDEMFVGAFLASVEEGVIEGMKDAIPFEVTAYDRMAIAIGGELYEISENGIFNGITGEEQDPNGLVADFMEFITNEHGTDGADRRVAEIVEQGVLYDSSPAGVVSAFDTFFDNYGLIISDAINEIGMAVANDPTATEMAEGMVENPLLENYDVTKDEHLDFIPDDKNDVDYDALKSALSDDLPDMEHDNDSPEYAIERYDYYGDDE